MKKKSYKFIKKNHLFRLFFMIVVSIVVASTAIDLLCSHPRELKPRFGYLVAELTPFSLADELLVSFSLWKNGKALISLERPANDIGTIHGIRLINAFLLLVSHKTMAVFINPQVNRTGMIEVSKSRLSMDVKMAFKVFFFCSVVGFRRLHIRYRPRSVDLHGRVPADQWPADIIRDRWPPPEKTVAANIPGILRPTVENRAHLRSTDRLLHLHPAAPRVRAAVELGGD